jgi:hypothetical protein
MPGRWSNQRPDLVHFWGCTPCAGQTESPVWYFNEDDWTIKQVHASVLDWLNCWCGIAEEAMAGGYFEQYRSGTTPTTIYSFGS